MSERIYEGHESGEIQAIATSELRVIQNAKINRKKFPRGGFPVPTTSQIEEVLEEACIRGLEGEVFEELNLIVAKRKAG